VGSIIVDPFAGSGTTIDVAKRMGKRVWARDLTPFTPNLPIHQHDITRVWPEGAQGKADLCYQAYAVKVYCVPAVLSVNSAGISFPNIVIASNPVQ
jgi:hypothetical protein